MGPVAKIIKPIMTIAPIAVGFVNPAAGLALAATMAPVNKALQIGEKVHSAISAVKGLSGSPGNEGEQIRDWRADVPSAMPQQPSLVPGGLPASQGNLYRDPMQEQEEVNNLIAQEMMAQKLQKYLTFDRNRSDADYAASNDEYLPLDNREDKFINRRRLYG